MKNQKGFSLVEVLAVLALSSLLILLIWTTVLTSMKHNVSETKKLKLQQEANYVIAEFQRIHRQCDQYEVEINDTQIELKNCNGPISNRIISKGYNYRETTFLKGSIDAKKTNAKLPFTLTIKDRNNEKLTIEISTTLSRYGVQ